MLTRQGSLAHNTRLPELSEAQKTKLRQLTLLTLASYPSNLTYSHLLPAMSLPSPLALDSLVTSSIYAGLLVGQINPLAERIDISSVAPLRDLRPGSIPLMIKVLEEWDQRCVNVLDELQARVLEVRKMATERKRKEDGIERQRVKLIDDGKMQGSGKRSVEGTGELDAGDIAGGLKRTRGAKGAAGLLGGLGKRLGGGGDGG